MSDSKGLGAARAREAGEAAASSSTRFTQSRSAARGSFLFFSSCASHGVPNALAACFIFGLVDTKTRSAATSSLVPWPPRIAHLDQRILAARRRAAALGRRNVREAKGALLLE